MELAILQNYIFISYCHKDRDYALGLVDALKGFELPCWIDGRIDYGSEWPRAIQKSLDSCAAFIVIMTTSSQDSIWVQNELARAQAKKKPIFPILLEGDVWLSVQAFQYVDVRDYSLPPKKFFIHLASCISINQNNKHSTKNGNITQKPKTNLDHEETADDKNVQEEILTSFLARRDANKGREQHNLHIRKG